MRVLVVEDSRSARRLLFRVLSSRGYDVHEAANGQEALEAIDGWRPEVIISDIMMPVMDGFALLRELRKHPQWADVPFIFYTATFISDKDRELALALGASRFIIKPTEPAQFLKQVEAALEEYTAGGLTAAAPSVDTETQYLKSYSERIIRRLEDEVGKLRHEVEERRKAEASLRTSEKRYRLLSEQASDGIFTIDFGGHLLTANPKGREMMGIDETEPLSLELKNILADDDETHGPSLPLNLLKAGHTVVREYTFHRKDGTSFPVEAGAKLLDRRTIQAIIRDISERKQADRLRVDSEANVRKAYADALSAVTGGRLLILTPVEMSRAQGEALTDPHEVKGPAQLSGARSRLMHETVPRFASRDTASSFILAADEALTNAVKHAGVGSVQLFQKGDTFQVVIADTGPGIDFSLLPRATLMFGFSTKQSLGFGFSIMLDTCDRVLLTTQPGDTRVMLEKRLGAAAEAKKTLSA